MFPPSSEIQDLMRSIEHYVQSPESADIDFIRDESVAYNDLCHEVNLKLKKVASLIDRGLRNDALDMARREGDLLSLFELLDFPNRAVWCQLVESFGLQRPPELDDDSAAKLNAAYAILEDLNGLLRNHRLFALAKAPLKNRIEILNALIEKDSENPIWQTDAAALQRVRLEQLRSEIAQCIRQQDVGKLRVIEQELTGSKWWIEVPPHLLAQTRSGIAEFARQDAMKRLVEAGEQLQQAYAAYDVRGGMELAGEIESLLSEAKPSDQDPTVEAIAPAMEWVAEQKAALAHQQRVQTLIEQLERALETHAKRAELEKALAAAESLGEELPAPLRERARERLESFEMVARRRGLLAIAAGVCLLLAGGAWLTHRVLQQQREREIASLEASMSRLLTEQQWEEAEGFLESLDESVRSRAVFLEAAQQVRRELDSERERTLAFAEVLDQLNNDDSGLPNYALVSRLRKLAKTEAEANVVAQQEARAENLRLARKQSEAAQQSKLFNQLQESVDAFFNGNLIGAERQTRLRELQKEVSEFVTLTEASNLELAGAARQIDKLLTREGERMQRDAARQGAITAITAAVGRPESFYSVIQQFVEAYPSDEMVGELTSVSQQRDQLDAALKWASIIQHPAFQKPDVADEARSREWLDLFQRSSAASPQHPFSFLPSRWKDHYQRIVDRPAAIRRLQSIFTSRLLGTMYVYPHPREGSYYSDMPVERDDDRAHVIRYFADLSMLQREKNFGTDYQALVLPNVRVSGQTLFGNQARPVINELNVLSFTPRCVQVLDMLWKMDAEKEVDPVFKLFMLYRLLEAMVSASQPLTDGYGELYEELKASDFNWNANWLSPADSDPRVATARTQAAEILRGIDNWDTMRKNVETSYLAFLKDRPRAPVWNGWIALLDNRWTILLKDPSVSGELMVILPGQGSNQQVIKLGSSEDRAAIPVSDRNVQIAGLPVFVLPGNE